MGIKSSLPSSRAAEDRPAVTGERIAHARAERKRNMATKKTVTEPVEEVLAEEPEKNEEEAPKSAWDEEIEMLIPRKPRGEEPFYYVCVNDRRFEIPANGTMQKLKKPIALVLQDSLAAEVRAEEFADSIPNNAPAGV